MIPFFDMYERMRSDFDKLSATDTFIVVLNFNTLLFTSLCKIFDLFFFFFNLKILILELSWLNIPGWVNPLCHLSAVLVYLKMCSEAVG